MTSRVIRKCSTFLKRIRRDMRHYNDLCDQWYDICITYKVGITA